MSALGPGDYLPSPEDRALLVEIMRKRLGKIDDEIAQLIAERRATGEWLDTHDTAEWLAADAENGGAE